MMPVSGERSAAVQESAGSSRRAAAPSISSSPSTPLARPWGLDRFEPGKLGVSGGDDQLTAFAMRQPHGGAKVIEQPAARRAQPGTRRAGRIVDAGMNHLAVARRDTGADRGPRLPPR